jgi:hypothetical protein
MRQNFADFFASTLLFTAIPYATKPPEKACYAYKCGTSRLEITQQRHVLIVRTVFLTKSW